MQGTETYCFKSLNSRAITTTVLFCPYHLQHTKYKKSQVKQHKQTGIKIIMVSSYIACEYDGHWAINYMENSCSLIN